MTRPSSSPLALALALAAAATRAAAQQPPPPGCAAPATTWAATPGGGLTGAVSVPGSLVITGAVAFSGTLALDVGCDLLITAGGSLTGVGPTAQRQGPAWGNTSWMGLSQFSGTTIWPYYGTGAAHGGCGDNYGQFMFGENLPSQLIGRNFTCPNFLSCIIR